jgi:ribosomal-protein-alanine N-acetyltransferase
MSGTVYISPLQEGHIDAVLDIEREAFPDPWSRRLFIEELKAGHALCHAALLDQAVAGYSTAWLVADELTINRLAVARQARGRGIAAQLLQRLVQEARELGATVCHIDVRSENRAARAFYAKAGFRHSGLRKKYYSDTGEDALLMSMPLDEMH